MQEQGKKSCQRDRSLLWLLEAEREEEQQQVRVQGSVVSSRSQQDRPGHCSESQGSRHHQNHRQYRPLTDQASHLLKHFP